MSHHKESYTLTELDAYKVPGRARNKCVNLFVPYKNCVVDLSLTQRTIDPKRGPCSHAYEEYKHCMENYVDAQQFKHISNAYFVNPGQAVKDGIAPIYDSSRFKSLISWTW